MRKRLAWLALALAIAAPAALVWAGDGAKQNAEHEECCCCSESCPKR